VDQFFNDSTGDGQDGEIDARGPWNHGAEWQLIEAPAFHDARANGGTVGVVASVDNRSTSAASEPEMLEELLVEQLRDLLSAEGQLVKALPKITRAANAGRLKVAFENHLEETNAQIERLKECFTLLGAHAKAKRCKGMAGLIEEGEEVIEEGKEKDGVAADLALVASAQKVEHYEISAYGTARTMAAQIGLPAVAALLSKSLAEEEIADNLLTQVARELMSESRTGATKEPKHATALKSVDD
jgi:Mn-containing catalase